MKHEYTGLPMHPRRPSTHALLVLLPPRSERNRTLFQNLLHGERLLVVVLEAHFSGELWTVVSLLRLKVPKVSLPVRIFLYDNGESLQNPMGWTNEEDEQQTDTSTAVGLRV